MSLIASTFRLFGQALFALLSFVLLLIALCLFALGLGIGVGTGLSGGELSALPDSGGLSYRYLAGNPRSPNRLLSVLVTGPILGSPEDELSSWMSLGGVTYGYQVQDLLRKAAQDASIKGVLLHLQTPGGTIFGSRAIHEGIKAYQQASGRPVLVYIEGLAASGGVMAMVGADAIYADHGSLIGSIGVLGAELVYFDRPVAIDGGLLGGGIVTEGGIEQTVISAGRGKDLGNPFRRPSADEIRNLQNGVNNEYTAFVHLVAEQRNIDEAVIREQMGAQVFDNQTAQAYGLIDGTLSRNQAIARLAELARLGPGDYQLVRAQNGGGRFLQRLLGAMSGQPRPDTAAQVQAQICQTAVRLPLVYYGDLTSLCR
ncbi:MAG TPA: S49 family peptidase [Candidatus Competibacteraceae bacterium]|nr:S49 family peptidase [Candidatus Competibacteraceae bacterium]